MKLCTWLPSDCSHPYTSAGLWTSHDNFHSPKTGMIDAWWSIMIFRRIEIAWHLQYTNVYKHILHTLRPSKTTLHSNPRGILHHRRCWNTKDRDVAHKGVTPQSADQQLHRVTSSHPGVAVIPHHTTTYHTISYRIIEQSYDSTMSYLISYVTTISTMNSIMSSQCWNLEASWRLSGFDAGHFSRCPNSTPNDERHRNRLLSDTRVVCWRGQRYEDLKNMVWVMHVIHLHLHIILFVWYVVPQAQSTEKGLAYRPKTTTVIWTSCWMLMM